jgi:hypothetical protein
MNGMSNWSTEEQREGRPSTDSLHSDVEMLMGLVLKSLPVDTQRYPAIAPLDGRELQIFCVRHSALHFSKTAGQLAELAEAIDHGAELKTEALRKIAISSLVNALKLADEVGLSGSEMAAEIRKKYL